jgi:hypothetical protein
MQEDKRMFKGDGAKGKHSDENGERQSTSAKQLAANRRNALRSTGPRTPAGKQATKLNALRHGLRASEIVIPGQEDPVELENLHQEYHDDWLPVGRTETNLVSQLAIDEWRLRRVQRAELGEIRRRNVESAEMNRVKGELRDAIALSSSELPSVLKQSVNGIDQLIHAVAAAMIELESEGTVSQKTCDNLDRLFGTGLDNPALLIRAWLHNQMPDWLRERMGKDSQGPLPAGGKAEKKAASREELELNLRNLERLKQQVRKKEMSAREIESQRLSIPSSPQLERILRYETAIKRDMFKIIEQLERLQRRRRGEPAPPTVNVKVSRED